MARPSWRLSARHQNSSSTSVDFYNQDKLCVVQNQLRSYKSAKQNEIKNSLVLNEGLKQAVANPSYGEMQLSIDKIQPGNQIADISERHNIYEREDDDLPSRFENMSRPFTNGENLIFDGLS